MLVKSENKQLNCFRRLYYLVINHAFNVSTKPNSTQKANVYLKQKQA